LGDTTGNYIGDLRDKYLAGGVGTYTRTSGSRTWTKTQTTPKVITIDPITAVPYTGSAILPSVTVKEGTNTLMLTTDYTVSYTNNTNVGTANVTITGVGNYADSSASATFTITPRVITFLVDPISSQTYTGSAIQPTVTVKDATKTLGLTTDYTVSYTNNINVGTANVTITGVGNYAGSSASTTFTIVTVNVTPTADDFNISGTGTFTHNGSTRAVTITPKAGKSTGTITVKYNGSTTEPSAIGTYNVTFDIAAATGWNAVNGFSAGTLNINATPIVADFNISGTGTFTHNGSSKKVTITPKAGKSTGTITIKYNGSTTEPSAIGTYTVTFDVAAAGNYNEVFGLSAGIVEIIPQTISSLNGLENYTQYCSPTGRIHYSEKAPFKAIIAYDDLYYSVYTIALNLNDITGVGEILKNYECFFYT